MSFNRNPLRASQRISGPIGRSGDDPPGESLQEKKALGLDTLEDNIVRSAMDEARAAQFEREGEGVDNPDFELYES